MTPFYIIIDGQLNLRKSNKLNKNLKPENMNNKSTSISQLIILTLICFPIFNLLRHTYQHNTQPLNSI